MASQINGNDKRTLINGLEVPGINNNKNVRGGVDYKAGANDIFIVSYPRSGINWMAILVHELINKDQPFNLNKVRYSMTIRYLERDFKSMMKKPSTQTKIIQTHYSFNNVPYNPKSKYICLIRQPKDVCLSLYRSLIEDPSNLSSIDFPTFVQLFLKGKTGHPDYFEHLYSIWSHKDDKNVLLVSYEQMKKDLHQVISRVAQFLNIELNENEQLVDNLEKYTSYEYLGKSSILVLSNFLQQCGFDLSDLTLAKLDFINNRFWYNYEKQKQQFDTFVNQKMKTMPGINNYWKL